MPASKSPPAAGGEQSIEHLQERFQKLNTKKIQAETNLENAKKQLQSLQQEALEKYQTADVAELRKKLDAMKRENEEKRRAYQADLDRIESDLAAVEQKFSSTESNKGNSAESR
jgi:chromosome segregation ATPase